jgi:iron complex outermembrane receptor protein
MQIPLSVIPAAGPTQTQFFNLNVHQHGLEIETLWQPIDRLQVLFNYAYLKATVDDGQCCFVDGVDPSAVQPEAQPFSPTTAASRGQYLDGQTVPQSPEHKLALNVNYTFAFRPGSLTVGASDIWKDATYYSVFNRYYSRAPSYNQIDLRATWKSANDHIALVAFGRNILDDNGYEAVSGVYQTQIPTGGIGVPTIPRSIAENVTLTNPRTYGLEVHYKF